jgi:hypothetical protein
VSLASAQAGVGSNAAVLGRSSGYPGPFQSLALGVGIPGEEDEAATLVGSADLVRAYNAPLRIEPDAGKVTEDGVESESKVSADVLKDCESGS